MEKSKFGSFALDVCSRAAGILEREFYKEIEFVFKGKREVVTEADKEVERFVREEVLKRFPDHGFVGEETGEVASRSGYTWILDPIDGTGNFTRHIPFFAVSLALEKEGEVILGVVTNPLLKETFYAEKGKGAYLNGKGIRCKEDGSLEKAFISSCHGRRDEDIERFVLILNNFKRKAYDMRKLGSASLEICYTACGRIECFIGVGVKPWDYKAGLLIAEEAGCISQGFGGGKPTDDGLVVCPEPLMSGIQEVIADSLNNEGNP